MNVYLRYGIAGHFAGVGHVDLHFSDIAGPHARLAEAQVVEFEGRVAEPISEWIKRLARDVPIPGSELGPVFGLVGEVVVVVERLFAGGVRPADGEFATGVHFAEENVGYGV